MDSKTKKLALIGAAVLSVSAGVPLALQAINEKRGITIVLISHDMDIVRRYAKRAIVLHYGKLVYDGTPVKLFDDSQPVERKGLCRPTVAALAASLGIEAATAEEFCKQVICKEGSR